MIRLLVRLPLILLVAVPLAWLGVLGTDPDPALQVGALTSDLERAYPESGERGRIVGESVRLVQGASGALVRLGFAPSPSWRAGLLVSAVHLLTLYRAVPLLFAFTLSGVTAGLIFRERMRSAEGYASPCAAGVARALVTGGLLALALFGLSPVVVDFAWIYAAILGISLGALLYTANLPIKL